MKTPLEIEAQIATLQKELVESKAFHEWQVFIEAGISKENIGCFNIGKLRKCLLALSEGRKLKLRHSVFGDTDISMNPQGNRVFCTGNGHFQESNIMGWLLNSTIEILINNPL